MREVQEIQKSLEEEGCSVASDLDAIYVLMCLHERNEGLQEHVLMGEVVTRRCIDFHDDALEAIIFESSFHSILKIFLHSGYVGYNPETARFKITEKGRGFVN